MQSIKYSNNSRLQINTFIPKSFYLPTTSDHYHSQDNEGIKKYIYLLLILILDRLLIFKVNELFYGNYDKIF